MSSFIKLLLFVILIGLPIIGIYSILTSGILTKSTCDVPIYYTIGTVDERYNATRDEFIQKLAEGEVVWEKVNDKNLFEYNPAKASLVVNLIYDARYELEKEADSLEDKLKEESSKLSAEERDYERDVDDFNRRLYEFNQEVSMWNSQGGAPSDVYEGLISRQKAFSEEAEELNKRATSLNRSASDYNAQIGELNANIDSLNNAYKQKPEQGIYDEVNNKIDIYLTTSDEELIHTIAHEFGHSMGIKHVEEDESIMHPYTSENLELTHADSAALSNRCEEKYIQTLSRSYMISFLKVLRDIRTTLLRFTS